RRIAYLAPPHQCGPERHLLREGARGLRPHRLRRPAPCHDDGRPAAQIQSTARAPDLCQRNAGRRNPASLGKLAPPRSLAQPGRRPSHQREFQLCDWIASASRAPQTSACAAHGFSRICRLICASSSLNSCTKVSQAPLLAPHLILVTTYHALPFRTARRQAAAGCALFDAVVKVSVVSVRVLR